MSVEDQYVVSMLDGSKTVELRRRVPRVEGVKRLWIYSKTPVAAVRAVADLQGIETWEPLKLWHSHRDALDLTLSDFKAYVYGRSEVAALRLGAVRAIPAVTLAELRVLDPNFHPPQFYLRLASSSALLRKLKRTQPSS